MTDQKTPNLRTNIAHAIKTRREKTGLTQEELAHKANCSRSTIGRIEEGVFSPSIEILVSIAAALGIVIAPNAAITKNAAAETEAAWLMFS